MEMTWLDAGERLWLRRLQCRTGECAIDNLVMVPVS